MPAKANQVCSAITQVSKDPIANSEAEDLCGAAKTYIADGNMGQLKGTIAQLENLNTQLNLAYTLKVVNKQGERTGVDRDYTDKSGKRNSGYYIIVEAINKSGQTLPMDITSIENGEKVKLQRWGESVPKAVFYEVSRDKKDNGILNDYPVFGVKSKGYLESKVTMKGVEKRGGQITRW